MNDSEWDAGYEAGHDDAIATFGRPTPPTIDVYPVGLLHDIKLHRGPRRIIRDFTARVKRGTWRSYLNGYLAEMSYPPQGFRHTKAGHGWTKRRALARLGRYLGADNPRH